MFGALSRGWTRSAKLTAGLFGSLTSGLTASIPSGSPDRNVDRNVDMLIGGQAVIEGVLMRSLSGYSIAVRQPNGEVADPRSLDVVDPEVPVRQRLGDDETRDVNTREAKDDL